MDGKVEADVGSSSKGRQATGSWLGGLLYHEQGLWGQPGLELLSR